MSLFLHCYLLFIHAHSNLSVTAILDKQYFHFYVFSFVALARFADCIVCLMNFLSLDHFVRTL